ncbi:MAG: phosphate signaling complex protein PhoU [Myxococcota bacterium]
MNVEGSDDQTRDDNKSAATRDDENTLDKDMSPQPKRHQHIHRDYEEELEEVRQRLLRMAGRVEEMIGDSVQSLITRNVELAERTIAADHKVNRDEMETDELCLVILAKRQPMAGDLRFLTTALKMVVDLERIGDLAVNICLRSIDLAALPEVGPYQDIPQIAENVKSMVHDAIDAFIDRDPQAARNVIEQDDAVDELYHKVNRELIEMMREEDDMVKTATHLQAIAKHLERMADHTTNLAEQVVFMVRGKDIRHHGKST